MATVSRTDTLRKLLKEQPILLGPCCHDGLSARLIERAGFSFSFMSGFCTSAARLGAPDTGLISYAEMVDVARNAVEATKFMPIIGDGDTGYGNALNVKRTVRGYALAGLSGILLEDQVAPKSCGHVKGKMVIGREEAVSRIRAAVDARNEGADILILARTDARQAVSFEEAMWRVQAFADAGADILFVDALESEEEMKIFCSITPSIPKMANNLEGGKTPILSPSRLQSLGFKLVAYPLSLLGVSIKAMEAALEGLKEGTLPSSKDLGTFAEIQKSVGFPEYYEEEFKYRIAAPSQIATPPPSPQTPSSSPPPPPSPPPKAAPQATSAVEADAVIIDETQSGRSSLAVTPPASQSNKERDSSSSSDRRSQYFRVKISDKDSGFIKLETRIPAGFLSGLNALVPNVGGFDLQSLVDRALNGGGGGGGGGRDPSSPLIDSIQGMDRIQVFLE